MLTRIYGDKSRVTIAETYKNNLNEKEKQLENQLMELAQQDGEFSIQRMHLDSAPLEKSESPTIDALPNGVEFFFAFWKERSPKRSPDSTAIGCFVFENERFRWVSTMALRDARSLANLRVSGSEAPLTQQLPGEAAGRAIENNQEVYKVGVNGIGEPKCEYCPDPTYTKLARKKHLEGHVVLKGIVEVDGTVSDIEAVSSPDAELTKMAIDGVTNWRLAPARRATGEAVAVYVTFDISFRLLRN